MHIKESFKNSMIATSISATDKVAVAVSGGIDSMALAIIASSYFKKPILAITVDHKIRKESKNEAEKVKKWFKKYNIQHHIITLAKNTITSNIQSNARDYRYNLMTAFCQENNISNLLVAHNKEDQAENVLIRLLRGSGVDGLCGMKVKTNINNINIIRPLLDIKKETLKEFLVNIDQEWIEDPSNQDEKYLRTNIRNFISQAEDKELLVDRLVKTANNMQRSRSYIEYKIADDMQNVISLKQEGYYVIKTDQFKKLHSEAAHKILATLLKNIGGKYYKTRFEKINLLYQNILNNSKIDGVTLSGCIIYTSSKKK